MTRLVVGPFNRVEGDVEVRLEIEGGWVRDARVSASMYRGFEQILEGKEPLDALVVAPRICGVCSVAQGLAAARALGAAAGAEVPANGRNAANLMLAVETAVEHVTHFYTAFMPDLARDVYAGEPWFAQAERRFKAGRGEALNDALPARTRLLHMMGVLAGKWPHTLALQPGGTTRALAAGERARMLSLVAAFRRFLETTVFGAPLEAVLDLTAARELERWRFEGDFQLFLDVSQTLDLEGLGRGGDVLMSYGEYPQDDGTPLFTPGLLISGTARPLTLDGLRENVGHSWYAEQAPRHPEQGATLPDADRPGGYSWAKAPRLDGAAVEVGAVARQAIAGQPLVSDMVAHGGTNVHVRVVARLIEAARLVQAMPGWINALIPDAPFYAPVQMPRGGAGCGLVEAARGGLGHWLSIDGNALSAYQVVSPTTWNFSPRDDAGRPGPLEAALAGTPVRPGETTPVAVQHVVRSFDPCMACTVH